MPKESITLPYKFTPRDYQLPILRALDRDKYKRAIAVWHRRSGKDLTFINYMFKKMFEKVGAYYYFFPTYAQGKKVLWEGMDREGFKFLNHLPKELRKTTNNQEMVIETVNGSVFRVIGTDKIDSVLGTNPIGCVFSEYSLQDPRAWDFIRPILAENGGWALFNYTPRGKNHGYTLLEFAKKDPKWYSEVLTVDDTKAISREVLDQEFKEIMAKNGEESLYQQEYYCSFDAPIQGAYYAKQMMDADREGRITKVPYDATIPVNTYWDLGVGDATSIWFIQNVGQEVRVIDYYESSGEGLPHYAKVLQDKKYIYGRHYAPHDIQVRELTTGRSRLETSRKLGINFKVVAKLPVEDGIEAVRNFIPRCWFDEDKCANGISALRSYHKEYDEKNQTYQTHPKHDWSSHGADAFRYAAIANKHTRRKGSLPEEHIFGKDGFY